MRSEIEAALRGDYSLLLKAAIHTKLIGTTKRKTRVSFTWKRWTVELGLGHTQAIIDCLDALLEMKEKAWQYDEPGK